MPSIKIYPPTQLPDRNVSETQFSIWCEELEVYLAQEEEFAQFLPDGIYSTWQSKESNADRITRLNDQDLPDPNTPANRNAKLRTVRTKLRTVLAIIGKCVSEGHYNNVIRHSTSLEWIYNTLRSDYDIQKRGIHFFNILEVKFDPSNDTPVSFYNKYRTVIVNNLSKNGDIIKYKGANPMTEDEKMTPMLEDVILLNVLREIDGRLPAYVKNHYNHRMQHDDKLMDLKTDILVNTPAFLEKIVNEEQNNSFKAAAFGAFKQQSMSKFKKKSQFMQNKRLYCRLCFLEKTPKEVFTSHNMGDKKCPSISQQDKEKMNEVNKFSYMKQEDEHEHDEEELAELFGYSGNYEQNGSNSEVVVLNETDHTCNFYRQNEAKNNFIRPVPSQVLTVFENIDNTNPVHIDLDSGATLNYCTEQEALDRGFQMFPNGQLSKLGDGVTNIKAVGEIHEIFFRNKVKLVFNAVVCKKLNSPFIGGTLFLKENRIEQDLAKDIIYLDGRQVVIQPTDHISILPTQPLISAAQVQNVITSKNITLKSRTLLPGQVYHVPVNHKEGTVLAIEPHERNMCPDWPPPQLQTVENGRITLCNNTNNAVLLGSHVKLCKITTTYDATAPNKDYYKYNSKPEALDKGIQNIGLISHNRAVSEEANKIIDQVHSKFHAVYNKDLTEGYNGYYGPHKCQLNWASSERPPASKVKIPSYDHDLKGIQQELMDDQQNDPAKCITYTTRSEDSSTSGLS